MNAKFRSVARAVLGAFTPASVTVWGFALAMVIISDPSSVGWPALKRVGMEWLLLGVGYGMSMMWLPTRRNRRETKPLHHAIAGILAPLTIFVLSAVVVRPSAAGIAALSFAGGSLVGILQWVFTRRTPSPAPPTLEELEADAERAFTQALMEGRDRADVISIVRRERAVDDSAAQVA